jgi:PRTRC genetic system protein D
MNLGIDLGYNAVKGVADGRTVYFPSVVGTPDRARFTVNGVVKNIIVAPDGLEKRLIGEAAIIQSRFVGRREDRAWIESPEYRYLLAAALTELTSASRVDCKIVTGLPVRYFEDKDRVRELFLGQHRIERDDDRTGAQVFNVTDVRVIPQPFGAVLAEALDGRGKIQANELATGDVGIIDIGGKTTNLLSVHKLAEVGRETTSVDVGAWDAMRVIREYLALKFTGLELRDHEIVEIVRSRQVKYFGEVHDLSKEVDRALDALGQQVLAQATQLWNNGARLDAILISGGGALLLGAGIAAGFRHSRIVGDPVYANARGYYNFSQRL